MHSSTLLNISIPTSSSMLHYSTLELQIQISMFGSQLFIPVNLRYWKYERLMLRSRCYALFFFAVFLTIAGRALSASDVDVSVCGDCSRLSEIVQLKCCRRDIISASTAQIYKNIFSFEISRSSFESEDLCCHDPVRLQLLLMWNIIFINQSTRMESLEYSLNHSCLRCRPKNTM